MSNFPEAPINGALAEVANSDGSLVQYRYDKSEAAWKIVGKVGGSDLEIVTTKDVVTTSEPPLAPAGWTGFNVQEDIQYLTNQKLVNWYLAEQVINNHNRPPIIGPGEPIQHPDLPGSPGLINGDIWVDSNNNIYIYLNGEWIGIITTDDFIADQLRQDNNINELTNYLQGLIDSGTSPEDLFVNKKGGDTMEGQLIINGPRKAGDDGNNPNLVSSVKVLSIDNAQNSSLQLRHSGTAKVYIGDTDISIASDIKFNRSAGSVVKTNVQDILNIGEREIAYLGQSIEDEDLITKKYVDDTKEFLQNEIIELEEEIEAIAPSVERGKWTFTAVGTVGQPGQFTMYDADFGNGNPTGLFKSAKSIWFNEIDSDGTPHAFGDVDDGELLEIFIDGSPEFGLYEVVGQAHDETQGANSFWVVDVNFIRTNEATTAVGPGELCRFKIFMAPTGGDASSFVMKSGDKMTGDLTIDRTTDGNTDVESRLTIEGSRPSSTDAAATIKFINDQTSTTGFLTYRSGSGGNWFGFNRDVDLSNNGLHSVGRIRMQSNGSISAGSASRIQIRTGTNSDAGTEIQRPGDNKRTFAIKGKASNSTDITDVFYAYGNSNGDAINYSGIITADNHITNKKYVDDRARIDISSSSSNRVTGDMWYNPNDQVLYLKVS